MPNQGQDNHVDQIIEAALGHIPFDGWSMASLNAAADDCGLDEGVINELFAGGPAEALEAYGEWTDRQMIEEFIAAHGAEMEAMPVHLRIRQLILIRLEQAAAHKEVVRRSLAFLSRPKHARLASKMLYHTVDMIWRTAGDRSTDFNFYTKRATLSAVYSSTLLAFLGDDTPDMAHTKAFLDRRLADVAKTSKMAKPVKRAAGIAVNIASRFTPFLNRGFRKGS